MQLVLTQCFPLKTTAEKPDKIKIIDSEWTLFLATDVWTNEETRQETLDFLEKAFQTQTLTAERWQYHVLHLTRTRDMKTPPSFAWIHWTNPVQMGICGRCQIVQVRGDQTFEVFKPPTPNTWHVSEQFAELKGHWLLCREDSELIEPVAETLKAALVQTQYPLEVFFNNLNFLKAKKQAVTVIRVEAIVDLDALNEHSEVRAHLIQMATQARPDTKALIKQFLNKKEVEQEFWTGKVSKVDYQAVVSDLKLKKTEIALLKQQTHLTKVLELEGDLARKNLEIHELQTKITTLTQQVGMMELVQKGAAATQKELNDLKESFKTLTLEKKQLVQQLKELQSVQNQSVTQQNGVLNQLKVAQAEKEYLQRVQNQAVAEKNQLSKQLENLQQVHNSLVTEKDRLFQQLKTAKSNWSNLQTEKDKLQSAHNQYVTQNEALFQIAQAEIKRLQKLLGLKEEAAKQPPKPIIIPTPVVEKPIIIPKPVVKTKLPFEPEMILVEGGTFKMGASYEKPIHEVTLSNFMIGKYPITQAQWKAVMGNNPSQFKGDDLPVEQVSWHNAQDFISKLNDKTGKTYRLPTEAQWEFAARGGNKSKGYVYSGSNNLDEVGWFGDNSDGKTHPVGGKVANELLIHDMSGNVWEWCADCYGNYKSSAAVTNPIGADTGALRMYRGGSWFFSDWFSRVVGRSHYSPAGPLDNLGIRVVLLPFQ